LRINQLKADERGSRGLVQQQKPRDRLPLGVNDALEIQVAFKTGKCLPL
jgi:hypothetical protein